MLYLIISADLRFYFNALIHTLFFNIHFCTNRFQTFIMIVIQLIYRVSNYFYKNKICSAFFHQWTNWVEKVITENGNSTNYDIFRYKIHIHYLRNYFNIFSLSVLIPSLIIPSHFQFLQSYLKLSLIKVAWYVLWVKNMHSWLLLGSIRQGETKLHISHY